MKTFLIVCMLLICASCTDHKKVPAVKNDEDLKLLKELAFCGCLDYAIKKFSKIDTAESYTGEVRNSIEANRMYTNIIDPLLDSLIFVKVIRPQIALKADTSTQYRSEGSAGTTDYVHDCLDLYNSKELEKFLKSIPPKDYKMK